MIAGKLRRLKTGRYLVRGGTDGTPRHTFWVPGPSRPSEPLPAGRAPVPAPGPDPFAPRQRTGGWARGPPSDRPLHGEQGGATLEDDRGRGPRRPRAARGQGLPPRHGGPGAAGLRPPSPDGRLLRVLDDAGEARHRPEGARLSLLRVPQRRGGLHLGPVHRWRDRDREGLRERGGPLG